MGPTDPPRVATQDDFQRSAAVEQSQERLGSAVCRGPATAFIATCWRLKWKVINAVTVITDNGKRLQFHLDSSAVVANQVKLSVKRWRWRNLERTMPQLAKGGSGNGALMAPVRKLLKSRQNDEEWNPACRGALRSALAGRQYPQVRVFAAGWSEHNRCVLCLHDIVQADLPRGLSGGGCSDELVRAWCSHEAEAGKKTVVATADQISRAPIGSSNHRIWKCQAGPIKEARAKWSRAKDRNIEASCNTAGHPSWERGFAPKPSPPKTAAAAAESFRWVVRPEGDLFHGDVYPDGSALDGPNPELMRCGWSFVVLCPSSGKTVASAMGVPHLGSWILEDQKHGQCCRQLSGSFRVRGRGSRVTAKHALT